ncbi:hypothetical protein GY45DRAFT_998439 [Cubamyces sp. BRFM 1775]|nr:hypothetical protein GY45DRAFT_998439 [Cubamyces sp. BRFM 1775]
MPLFLFDTILECAAKTPKHRLQSLRLLRTRRPAPCAGPIRASTFGRFPYSTFDGPSVAPQRPQESEEPMPPDYESRTYWKDRFEGEGHFEWLGDGKDTIIPHVRSHLINLREHGQPSARAGSSTPARVLHVGAGTSSLSERLRELYLDVYGDDVDERAIVNADFAENLVVRKRTAEEARRAGRGPCKGMRWVCADALKWTELDSILKTEGHTFDLVVDKSTSDAISCGEDICYTSADPKLHPAFNNYLAAGKSLTLSPVEVFAIHLSSLVHPGGLWIALTFSSNRFPFWSSPTETTDSPFPRAADYWNLDQVITVDAPTGLEGNAHAPVVQHHVYILRRKGA